MTKKLAILAIMLNLVMGVSGAAFGYVLYGGGWHHGGWYGHGYRPNYYAPRYYPTYNYQYRYPYSYSYPYYYHASYYPNYFYYPSYPSYYYGYYNDNVCPLIPAYYDVYGNWMPPRRVCVSDYSY